MAKTFKAFKLFFLCSALAVVGWAAVGSTAQAGPMSDYCVGGGSTCRLRTDAGVEYYLRLPPV